VEVVDLLRSCRGSICLGEGDRGGGVVVHGPDPQDLDLHGARELVRNSEWDHRNAVSPRDAWSHSHLVLEDDGCIDRLGRECPSQRGRESEVRRCPFSSRSTRTQHKAR
jgi:hypothetical protein